MMVFLRRLEEEVVVDEIDGSARQLKVRVLEINEGSVRLGFELSAEVPKPFDRKHPEIRELVAILWRNRHALRSHSKCPAKQPNAVQGINS